MSKSVNLDELLTAFEWVSAGEAAAIECNAYVSRRTGQVHWVGEGVDEEPPEDIDDASVYVAVPHKGELALGRSVALRFVEAHLAESYETVFQYFRRRGAYSRFKALLERTGQLEAWYRYEQNAVEQALGRWCQEHDLHLTSAPGQAGG